jgi:very-short-patch-repair endonuclease
MIFKGFSLSRILNAKPKPRPHSSSRPKPGSDQSRPRSRSRPCPRRHSSGPKPNSSPLTESELEGKFLNLVLSYHLPKVTQQHQFHPQRQWRWDFCWPQFKLAVEIQGFGPGHNSYSGMSNDYEKHNEAILLGWRVLYFMSHDLNPKNAPATISIVRNTLGIPTPITISDSQKPTDKLTPIERGRRKLDQIINKNGWS